MRRHRSDAGQLKGTIEPGATYGDLKLKDAPQDFARAYRAARTAEAREKSRWFAYKNGILTGKYLDRKLLGQEMTFILIAVRDFILGCSSLSARSKDALLRRISTCIGFEAKDPLPEAVDSPIPAAKPPGWTDYMYQRLREIDGRARNIKLRVEALSLEVLERAELERVLPKVVAAIMATLERTALAPGELRDIARNLAMLGSVCASVASRQKGAALASVNGHGANGDGNGDGVAGKSE